MSTLYIRITDRTGKHYLCPSVSNALLVARYIARHQSVPPLVESNSAPALDDFTKLTNHFFKRSITNG